MNPFYKVTKNISNIPGWRTNRKILVIESDDWGSVRIRDKESFDFLKMKGLNVGSSHYDSFESLESNDDLEHFFELVSSFKDKNGKSLVVTPMCIMGNPDFEKIRDNEYSEYYFQPLKETINEYPRSNRILELWKKGYNDNIFVPELHGREHINVRRYMHILQSHAGKEGLRYAAERHSIGPSMFFDHVYPNYLGALFPILSDEISDFHNYLKDAGDLFLEYLDYQPRVFIAPNMEEPKELESTLQKIGVRYITRSKYRKYPIGDGEFIKEWNFMGDKTEFGQVILNRNASFEPVCHGEHEQISDWVDHCLREIEIAFRWKKPAIVSTHRVNYIGGISEANRSVGFTEFRRLIKSILIKWPDIEFMSSFELGELIRNSKKSE